MRQSTSTLEPERAQSAIAALLLFPSLAALLLLVNNFVQSLTTVTASLIFTSAILLAGVPHGSLDIEILARHLGRAGALAKTKLTIAYATCALLMTLVWLYAPPLALVAFLIISILHFGLDWRDNAEPFLGMTVGWALVALPALSHPQDVTAIFNTLVGVEYGATLCALLACSSVPAALVTIAFCHDAYSRGNHKSAVHVASCLFAAVFLPPLASFALFFCGLHSPRHFADAVAQSGPISHIKKGAIIIAVVSLSLGIAVWIFTQSQTLTMSDSAVRATFILLSILTLPHFILEQILARSPAKA